jgi:hypothetical protein
VDRRQPTEHEQELRDAIFERAIELEAAGQDLPEPTEEELPDGPDLVNLIAQITIDMAALTARIERLEGGE